MIGLAWALGLVRALVPGRTARLAFVALVCAVPACSGMPTPVGDPPMPQPSFPPPSSGGSTACIPPATKTPAFAQQVVGQQTLFSRQFYTWTTAVQVQALRQTQNLFSEAAGSGEPFTQLTIAAASGGVDARLAQVLSDEFKWGRYAWPEPWTTRMGWPGQDPGHQLVRVVLRPEAWLGLVTRGNIVVYDAQQRFVPATEALAHPDHIGAIFFESYSATADPLGCNSGSGYREFLLGNLAMVQEWSVGTQQIADRIQVNIGQLTQFLNDIRGCPVTSDATTWAQIVLCSWFVPGPSNSTGSGAGGDGGGGANGSGSGANDSAGFGLGGFDGAPEVPGNGGFTVDNSDAAVYGQALAIPSANYLAAPAQIAAMIGTLQGDLFAPDPLVVTLGSP